MESIVSQSGVLNLSNTEIRKDGKALLTAEEAATKTEYKFFASANVDCSSKPKVVVVDNSDSYDTASGLVKGKTLSSLVTETILGIATTSVSLGNTGFLKTKGEVQDDTLTGGVINQNVYITSTGELSLSPSDKKIGTLVTTTAPIKVLVNLGGELSNSGSGAAGENFITDYIAANALITNFATYNDAAAIPLDATGGTASDITFSINNTLPLRASGDFKFSKAAVNAQGEGVSYDFDYPEYAKNQEVSIEFNYRTTVNYVSGDVGIYLYDITNGSLIYPTVTDLPQTTEVSKFRAKFFATSADQYRLVIHVKSTSSTAYDIQMDEFVVKRNTSLSTSARSDAIKYDGAFGTDLGIVTERELYFSRDGEFCEIYGSYRAGATLAGTSAFIPLPPGINLNASKVISLRTKLGQATRLSAGTAYTTSDTIGFDLVYDSSLGANCLRITDYVSTLLYVQRAGNVTTSNDRITFTAKFPVAGWSSNINIVQSQTEFAYNTDTSTSVDDTTDFGYGPEGVNFVAISSASNYVKKRVRFTQPIQITDKLDIEVYNGIAWQSIPYAGSIASDLISTLQTDVGGPALMGIGLSIVNLTDVDVCFGGNGRVYANGTPQTWNGVTSFKWRVRKSAGSAVGEVAPFVGAKYNTTVAATSNSTAPIQWNIKEYDTHNAVTIGAAWKFIAPLTGYYNITGVFQTSGVQQWSNLYKNGILKMNGAEHETSRYVGFNYYEYLTSGEYIDVRAGASATITSGSSFWISIAKIG